MAGGSASAEYEKRSRGEQAKVDAEIARDAAWRADLRARRPLIGRIVTATTPRPRVGPESQPTRAWSTGAAGEERVASALATAPGVMVLHDRLKPGSKANIDHIAIGPGGVFVIDAKNYRGRLEVRSIGGVFRSELRLYIDGRNRTSLVDGMASQLEVVRATLGERFAEVPVVPVLCFVGADWGRLPRATTIRGVSIVRPDKLVALVADDGPWTTHVAAVTAHLDRSLIPAA